MEPPAFRRSISNGSISIALKHRIALYDLLSRRDTPPAAIVLEDDAADTVKIGSWCERGEVLVFELGQDVVHINAKKAESSFASKMIL